MNKRTNIWRCCVIRASSFLQCGILLWCLSAYHHHHHSKWFPKQCWWFSLCANCHLQICIRTLNTNYSTFSVLKFFCAYVQFWILLPQRKMFFCRKQWGLCYGFLVDFFWSFCSRGVVCSSLQAMESTFNFGWNLFGVCINIRNLWSWVSDYLLVRSYDQSLPPWVTCTFGKILWEQMQINNFISRVEKLWKSH